MQSNQAILFEDIFRVQEIDKDGTVDVLFHLILDNWSTKN